MAWQKYLGLNKTKSTKTTEQPNNNIIQFTDEEQFAFLLSGKLRLKCHTTPYLIEVIHCFQKHGHIKPSRDVWEGIELAYESANKFVFMHNYDILLKSGNRHFIKKYGSYSKIELVAIFMSAKEINLRN